MKMLGVSLCPTILVSLCSQRGVVSFVVVMFIVLIGIWTRELLYILMLHRNSYSWYSVPVYVTCFETGLGL